MMPWSSPEALAVYLAVVLVLAWCALRLLAAVLTAKPPERPTDWWKDLVEAGKPLPKDPTS